MSDMNWDGYELLREFVEQRREEFILIPEDRKELLKTLAQDIRQHVPDEGGVDLIFICTHNSRRSHMGHLWAQLAAAYYQVERIHCFSGGTEATAFNPRALKVLVNAGMEIVQLDESSNPKYRIGLPGIRDEILVFSKKYSDPPNPTEEFIAVMTCSDADEACPVVSGASSRYAVRYKDPKIFDGTSEELERYEERSSQVAREMLFLFSEV